MVSDRMAFPQITQASGFAAPLAPDWRGWLGQNGAGIVSALVVGALFSALALIEAGPMSQRARPPLVVAMTLSPESSPSAPAKPQAPPRPVRAAAMPHPAIPSRTPQVSPVAVTPQPVSVASAAAPAPAAPSAPVAAGPDSAAAPSGATTGAPVANADLDARLMSFAAPAYPIESRRQREQGTVTLSLLLDTDGRVKDIAIARSSGSGRLDRAALDAVKRWRWAPLMVQGMAAMVRGEVRIPFVLKG